MSNVLTCYCVVRFKNMVIGLLFGDIPAVNSLESVLRCMERTCAHMIDAHGDSELCLRPRTTGPVVYAAMLKLQRQLGPDRFPLIAMNYYPNLRARSVHTDPA